MDRAKGIERVLGFRALAPLYDRVVAMRERERTFERIPHYTYQAFDQAIVIPETIDAIRALTGLESDPARSIAKTDASPGLLRDFLRDRGPHHERKVNP